MLNTQLNLNQDVFHEDVELKAGRDGFGDGILEAGSNKDVVVLCADLTESTRVAKFSKKYPERFFQTGVAEQNMASIASGLAVNSKIPFIISHAIFNPSRNWDQIRASICFSEANVKIVGTHLGFSNGRDGGIAESLEDIALMRVLPGMTVVQPVDALEAQKAVKEAVKHKGPVYLRISKEPTPLVTTERTPFEIGKAYLMAEGKDLTIFSSGPITHEALLAARDLKIKHKISAEVISCSTVKPLDEETILKSAKKTGKVFTIEEHQTIGGLGSAIAELLSEKLPTPMKILGMKGVFGESGSYKELKDKFGLSSHNIVEEILWTY